MSPAKARKVLERRREHLAKKAESGYYSKGRSEYWVLAEISALDLAIAALTGKEP